jgi:hypothetical protein
MKTGDTVELILVPGKTMTVLETFYVQQGKSGNDTPIVETWAKLANPAGAISWWKTSMLEARDA